MLDSKTKIPSILDGTFESDVSENIGGIDTHTQRFSIRNTNARMEMCRMLFGVRTWQQIQMVKHIQLSISPILQGKGMKKVYFYLLQLVRIPNHRGFEPFFYARSFQCWSVKSSLDALVSLVPTAQAPDKPAATAQSTATKPAITKRWGD